MAGVLVLVTILEGCGGGETSTFASLPSDAGQPRLVGDPHAVVTVIVPSVPTNLNPHVLDAESPATEMVTSLTDPQVFQVGPKLSPVLDTNFVISAEVQSVNPMTVVYTLNPKAVWSDGVPIGIQDFVFNWEQQTSTSGSESRDADVTLDTESTLGYRDIETITGPSTGDTVKVVFDKPYADWEDLFNNLIPEHMANTIGWDDGYAKPGAQAFVSGGPYRIKEWLPGKRIVLERNPRWWGTPAKVATLVIEKGPSEDESKDLVESVSSGAAQVVYTDDFDEEVLGSISSDPRIQSQLNLGTTMLQVVFDLHKPLDASVDVREGIALSLDRSELVQDLIQPVDPNVQVDDDFLSVNAEGNYTKDGTLYDYSDTQLATTDLDSAGLSRNASGSWTSGGSPVTIDFTWASDDPWSQLVAPTIEAELIGAGFEVRADPVDASQLSSSQLSGSAWDLALAPVAADPYTGQMVQAYSTAEAATGQGASTNASGFESAQVDTLFELAATQLDPVHADALYQQIDQILWQDLPAIPLFAEPTLVFGSASVRGVQPDDWVVGPLWSAPAWERMTPKS